MTNIYKTRFINGMSTMYKKTFLIGCFKWYLLRPWEFFKDVYREIKAFLQRGYRGYADSDTWSLDQYLSRVISQSTKHLSENINSFPDALTEKMWRKILKEISENIIAPYELDDDEIVKDVKVYKKKLFKALDKQRSALRLLVIYFPDLWD